MDCRNSRLAQGDAHRVVCHPQGVASSGKEASRIVCQGGRRAYGAREAGVKRALPIRQELAFSFPPPGALQNVDRVSIPLVQSQVMQVRCRQLSVPGAHEVGELSRTLRVLRVQLDVLLTSAPHVLVCEGLHRLEAP